MECAFLKIRKMKSQVSCFIHALFFLGVILVPSSGLSEDGTLLLSFKYSVSNDPLSVLGNWNYEDGTPCSWTGVSCVQKRVVGLVLPGSRLLGTIPEDLGFVEKLQILDLSGNFLNGTLPLSLLNASELKVLNVSDNGFSGNVPALLASMPSLSVISVRKNFFSGAIPGGFRYAEVLDFSGNSLNGSLPIDFGGERLTYLNLSSNKLSGMFPAEFAGKIPANATIDLSLNSLTGEIPKSMALSNQKTESFRGNLDLCGKPLTRACTVPSSFSFPPNITSTNSSTAAIAAIPQTIGSNPSTNPPNAGSNQGQHSLKPGTIAGIAVGDLAGLGVIAMVCLYVYQLKTKKSDETETIKAISQLDKEQKNHSKQHDSVVMEITTSATARTLPSWSCLSLRNVEETTSESAVSDIEDEKNNKSIPNQADDQTASDQKKNMYKDAKSLVMVDGETELELESLLRASAYILGSSTSSSIVYKAVLENGTAFAVRRIGDGVERLKEFENHAKAITKLRHPNLVVLRGFYWGEDEKLVIYDYISNGSLANADYRRMGSSSPYHMPFQVRLKIAKGIARGLAYIHEKKHVHGNIKPSNILLTSEMEPVIGDFGLQWLMYGKNNHNETDPHSSSRHFGSKRGGATAAPPATSSYRDGSPCIAPVGFLGCTSPYHAPESFKNQKPNPKWDVYSFGILLLELLTGKVFSDRELGEWASGHVTEDRDRVLRMADVGIRGDEDAVLACFKLGFKCASLIPGKRPSMKDARQVLDKIPCASPY